MPAKWYRTLFEEHPLKNTDRANARTSGGKLLVICKACLAQRIDRDQSDDREQGREVRGRDMLILSCMSV